MRLFIALDLDPPEYFAGLQEKITIPTVRLSMARSFHLTLKFLGDVDSKRKDQIIQALRKVQFSPLELRAEHIGAFPESGDPRVVWIGVDGNPALQRLQADIDTALSAWFPIEKDWVAHITLARVKDLGNARSYRDKVVKIPVPPQKFAVNSFLLVASVLTREGAVYEIVAEYLPKSI
ncbi:RNA 2',3'-cyclic phosphodiesterase [Candidatus Woesearchaeota archaeon]|nr:RNA 2',3'-cyclic phosphodiesterase [Candidatus Woesearchaeota archaeon]